MKCSLCNGSCRARTSAFVLGEKLERKLVCSTCASGGMLIVPTTGFATRCAGCGRNATRCDVCARAAELKPGDTQRAIAKRLRAFASVTIDLGRAEVLKEAADMVDAMRIEPEPAS